jgi:general secretion pathway protein J
MNRQHGFTLLEMLLAMTLLGLLSVALFGGMRFMRQGEAKVTSVVEAAETYGLMRDVMTRQIAAAFPVAAQTQILFNGKAERIAFPILRLPGQGAAGLTLAVFDIVTEDGLQRLYYREYAFLPSARIEAADQPTRSTLLAEATGPMHFRFRDRAGVWRDQWADGAQMPRLVGLVTPLGPEIIARPHAEPGTP